MSPVNSMFVCIKKKKKKKLSANLFLKWPISIIGKMLNIGADNRSTPRAEPCFVYSVTGETLRSTTPTVLPAGRDLICTNSVSLWDYGINKFNFITFQCNSCYNVRIKEQ